MQEGMEYAVLHEFVTLAKRNVTQGTWDYIVGGAETETTQERNRVALDSIAFRPRVLRDVERVDTSATLLGLKLNLPVILAPIGSLQDFEPAGGVSPSRAAARTGVLHMLSSASAPGIEAVAASNPHPKLFQLYIRGDDAWVEDHIERAIKSGYKALCFTVDLDWYGRRERDLTTRLGGEIARVRTLYEQRVPAAVRQGTDYVHEELIRTLADGDASLLEAKTY
jgi:glycolate oxidase